MPPREEDATRRRRGTHANDHRRYDLVIVDTAPTGHTLRLLAAPATVAAAAEALDELQAERRFIRERLAGSSRPEAADRFIALLRQEAEDVAALIRDPHRSSFHWVMLPEQLALAETAGALTELERMGISVGDLIVNRVIPNGPACPICDRLRAAERRVLARIHQQLATNRRIRFVPDRLREPRGLEALAQIGRDLTRSATRGTLTPTGARSRAGAGGTTVSDFARGAVSAPRSTPTTSAESIPALLGARVVFFGGKGGVGKTTLAAATAVRMARAVPRRRVLLMSTDPAHSLGDVLGGVVGNRPAALAGAPKNLQVREVDAAAALAARRADIQAAVDGLEMTVSAAGPDLSALFDLAPPGVDELLAIVEVSRLLSAEPETRVSARPGGAPRTSVEDSASATSEDLIIIDTAPTGHALRLLQMPAIMREWLQVLMRLLLKYRAVVRSGRLGSMLVELSASIRRGCCKASVTDAESWRSSPSVISTSRSTLEPSSAAARWRNRSASPG